MKISRSALLALLDSLGATSDDSELEFFSASIHYADAQEGVGVLAKFPGINAKGVYVQCAS